MSVKGARSGADPVRSAGAPNAERILGVATGLFAERGFDGVSVREIAARSGLNVAMVHYYFGTKRNLYEEVVRRANEVLVAPMQRALDAAREVSIGDAEAVAKVFEEALVGLAKAMAERPELPRLFVARWAEDTEEASEATAAFSLALTKPLKNLLEEARERGAIAEEVDAGMFLRSHSWLVYGYFMSGPINWRMWRGDPQDPQNFESFETFLRRYARTMLEPGKKDEEGGDAPGTGDSRNGPHQNEADGGRRTE